MTPLLTRLAHLRSEECRLANTPGAAAAWWAVRCRRRAVERRIEMEMKEAA